MDKTKDLIDVTNSEGEVLDAQPQINEEDIAKNDNLKFQSDIKLFDKLSEYNIDKNDFDHIRIVLDALSSNLDNCSEEVLLSYEFLKSKLPSD